MQKSPPSKACRSDKPDAPYRLELQINGLPRLFNALRTGWLKRKDAREWINKVQDAVGQHIPSSPLSKYSLKLTRKSSRQPDYDGLVISFKHVVDALVRTGILEDDKLSNSGPWDCQWEKAKQGEGSIEVQVTERSE